MPSCDLSALAYHAVMSAAPVHRNFAFIDGQNLYLGVRDLGWRLDYRRLRIYLTAKFDIAKALLFIGYVPANKRLYQHLRSCGFELVFKEIDLTAPTAKGNVDVDLTLHVLTRIDEYARAALITSDGDFAPVVSYLKGKGKFETVISPSAKKCSRLLKRAAGQRITYLDSVRSKIERTTK